MLWTSNASNWAFKLSVEFNFLSEIFKNFWNKFTIETISYFIKKCRNVHKSHWPHNTINYLQCSTYCNNFFFNQKIIFMGQDEFILIFEYIFCHHLFYSNKEWKCCLNSNFWLPGFWIIRNLIFSRVQKHYETSSYLPRAPNCVGADWKNVTKPLHDVWFAWLNRAIIGDKSDNVISDLVYFQEKGSNYSLAWLSHRGLLETKNRLTKIYNKIAFRSLWNYFIYS